eukprot:gene37714-59253_t
MDSRTLRLIRVGDGSVAARCAPLRRCIGSIVVEVEGAPVATVHEMAAAMRGRATIMLRFRAAQNSAATSKAAR